MDLERLIRIERASAGRSLSAPTRRRFMTAVLAASGGAAGIAALGNVTSALADERSGGAAVREIIDIAVTAEALAVTYLGAVISNAYAGATGLDATVKTLLQAARAEEYAHFQLLKNLGAEPQTLTFFVPEASMVTDRTTALETIAAAEQLFINAYLSAIATFSQEGQHTLAVYAASILGTECEHRSLARAALSLNGVSGFSPANNWDFEQAPLPSVQAVASELKQLGFFGPKGIQAPFNATGIVTTGVTGTTPPELDPDANRP
jgi:ferritin-like protein